ncbi:2OG-Fe(II) oxygenase [Mycena indigotica]|uniref:2OG-Fe(II) oxygenase n=1 Tax=Mycena indigotica TaxID=2126181 RepID=A0A8H6WHH5_9AGAR|nr:2OG-Fe(II) oxygenase [Mycena indigotica]KAF7315078.1 2OG-Fe(II) oxygenase [Mycena indigotica]
MSIPVIDASALSSISSSSPEAIATSNEIFAAASEWGFFQLINTPVTDELQAKLLKCAEIFFALDLEDKLVLDVRNGGTAWRGYMPLGGEGTHGRTDHKEGIYFGPEHPDDHPLLGMPLHGKNQFPSQDQVPEMRETVLEYIAQVTLLGTLVVNALSVALGLGPETLENKWLKPEPVALFRCFKYAAVENAGPQVFGIGEHSDFGLLTILKQASAGLQVKSPAGIWCDVPVIPNAFVVNVGDMLDQLTGGRLPSRYHRVLPPSPDAGPRFSFPFFFDFSWSASMVPLDLPAISAEERAAAEARWRSGTFTRVEGQWWQYLAKKVKKVFPDLALPEFEANSAPSTRFTRPIPTAKVVA